MANAIAPPDISETMAAPLGDLIAAVGRGLAEAQQGLDAATIKMIQALHAGDDQSLELLRRLGYQPTWYRIPELNAEITISMAFGQNGLYASPIDANYTNKYDFDLKAASTIRFKVVPVPPASQAEQLKVVPKLVGATLGEARRRLGALGIPFDVGDRTPSDDRQVQAMEPGPGSFLDPGEQVRLKFDDSK